MSLFKFPEQASSKKGASQHLNKDGWMRWEGGKLAQLSFQTAHHKWALSLWCPKPWQTEGQEVQLFLRVKREFHLPGALLIGILQRNRTPGFLRSVSLGIDVSYSKAGTTEGSRRWAAIRETMVTGHPFHSGSSSCHVSISPHLSSGERNTLLFRGQKDSQKCQPAPLQSFIIYASVVSGSQKLICLWQKESWH